MQRTMSLLLLSMTVIRNVSGVNITVKITNVKQPEHCQDFLDRFEVKTIFHEE